MKGYVKTPQGRIAYRIYGDGARDMVMFHGLFGSSRLSEEWMRAIEKADFRCIALERPGYGDSSPVEMERAADWAGLFAPVVEKLAIHDAAAVGCSAGSVYAYASAFSAPGAIESLWILEGVPAVYLDRVLRHYRWWNRGAYRRFLKTPRTKVENHYLSMLDRILKTLPSDDDPSAGDMRRTLEDVRANRCFGPAQESRLQITPWGFDPASITQPVTLHHAERDTLVPYDAAREMHSILKNATLITADPKLFAPKESPMDIHTNSISRGFLGLLAEY